MRGRYLYSRRGGGFGYGDREASNQQWSLQGGSGEMATTGTVKWFSPKKGYGFITMEDGQEVFVHYSAIDGNGFRSLEQGERVQFEVSQGPKGLQAANVMRA
jgi:CspA family cold shock protein